MLDTTLKTQLQGHLQRITRPVELTAWLDASASAGEMHALLAEIVALSPQLSLVTRDEVVPLTPCFSVGHPDVPGRIRFAGVPLGHEFTSLVLALLHAGGHPPKVDAGAAEALRALDGPLHFETFVSLSCQNCPDVVQALNLIAVLNPGVTHTMIDGALQPEEVERRKILSVPAVYLNGQPFAQGRMSLAEILARLDTGAGARRTAQNRARAPYDVLVVGGGPAGAAAAIYAARKGIRTGLAAERFGGQVLDTLGIENFISVQQTQGPALVAALEEHVRAYGVDVMEHERVRALRPGQLIEVELDGGATLRAKSVIVATGARWRELDVPGERDYRNRGVAYCPHCDGPLFRGRRVAVIGGGNSGVEAAIDLAGLASHVTLLEYDTTLRADAVLTRRLAAIGNLTVLTGAQTTAVLGDGERVTGLRYRDRASASEHTLELAGVFVQIGLMPNTDWLAGTLRLSPRGEIEVDGRGQTSVPGVYAAGDCTTAPYKQIVIAMGDGARAALGAFDHLIRQPLSVAA